ncbi:MAG: ATP-dependent helicase/Type restriction enzyme [Myxococcaceae bacterium]|nr:ATP-dependent helicase/Type restriction enzyme [Myxococcaceae bacterium]
MALRPYQTEAFNNIISELGRVRATLLVLATGLGKTVCFSAVARRYIAAGSRVLVIAHRGELLEQAANVLRRFGLLVAVEQGAHRVDPHRLPDVTIASVQTLRGKRLARFRPDSFALVIVDESHHSVATTYRAIIDHFATAKVLGVTATPGRTDEVGLRNAFDSVAYRMEIGAGIAAGWLAPIELRTMVVDSLDLSRVRSVAGELHAGELADELTRDSVLHEIASPLADLYGGRQTLVFTAGVAQAHALSDVLCGHGVRAAAVDGRMSKDDRDRVIGDYRAGRLQMVCNAMVLTEGFDAPETACIALVRPTRSRSLLTQMIGRGTRTAPGKTSCLVLDFVAGRAASMRLAAPADALAGTELPESISARVRAMSGVEATDLGALIESACKAEQEAAEAARAAQATRVHDRDESARLVRTIGVAYAAHIVPVAQLLAAMSETEYDPMNGDEPIFRLARRARDACSSSEAQRTALEKAGFVLPQRLSAHDADRLFRVLADRRRQGLCSIRQARQLRRHGLRDDVTFDVAREALDAIAANGWRPPSRLYHDERFIKAHTAEP